MQESNFRQLPRYVPWLVLGVLALQACGGGGGGGGAAPPPPNPWTAGVFKSAQTTTSRLLPGFELPLAKLLAVADACPDLGDDED